MIIVYQGHERFSTSTSFETPLAVDDDEVCQRAGALSGHTLRVLHDVKGPLPEVLGHPKTGRVIDTREHSVLHVVSAPVKLGCLDSGLGVHHALMLSDPGSIYNPETPPG